MAPKSRPNVTVLAAATTFAECLNTSDFGAQNFQAKIAVKRQGLLQLKFSQQKVLHALARRLSKTA